MNATKPQNTNLEHNAKNVNTWAALAYPIQRHGGSIIESIIRKRGDNLSKLAKYMNISRCTLYSWFEKDSLPLDVLLKIGTFINYDFSKDFPEVFSTKTEIKMDNLLQNQPVEQRDIDHWKLKYIFLLERYNESLVSKEKLLMNM